MRTFLAAVLAMSAAPAAHAAPGAVWDALAGAVFPLVDAHGQRLCTAVYVAPADPLLGVFSAGYAVTAGHCAQRRVYQRVTAGNPVPVPRIAAAAYAPGVDAAVLQAHDGATRPMYVPLARSGPAPADAVLTAGYSGGVFTLARMVYRCQVRTRCLHFATPTES